MRRGVFNTRPRDFYDVYILGTTRKYDKTIFKEALRATAEHRGSLERISDSKGILKQIAESKELREVWRKYQNKFVYAKDILYESIIKVVGGLTE